MQVVWLSAQTSTIIGYQYWFNQDHANRTTVAVTTPTSHLDVNGLNISTPGSLSVGLHEIHFRLQQNDGTWSAITSYSFLKPRLVSSTNIIGYEYWFDQNHANRVYQSVSGTIHLDTTLSSTDASALSPGLHNIHFRLQDDHGMWSSVTSYKFRKMPVPVNNEIIALRYWTDQSTNPNDIVTISWNGVGGVMDSINIDLCSADSIGPLNVFFQMQDAFGHWSAVIDTTINVLATGAPADPVTITGPDTICAGTSVTYTINSTNGAAAYIWDIPGLPADTTVTNSITFTAPAIGGVIEVQAINGCGASSNTASKTIVVSGSAPAQPGPINGPTSVCSGSSVTYSIAAVTGANDYIWTLPGATSNSTSTSVTFTASQSGVVSVVANSACGSTPATTLAINVSTPPTASVIDTTVCFGEVVSFGGQTYTSSIVVSDTITTGACDSIVTLDLTVLNEIVTDTVVQICQGQSYTFDGTTYSTSVTPTAVFTSANGCDSTVNLTLQVVSIINATDTVNICDGDTYSFGTQNITQAGNFSETFTSNGGCDSVVALTLYVDPVYSTISYDTICGGDSVLINGVYETQAGIYTIPGVTVADCDSTQQVVLTLLPQPSPPNITQYGADLISDVSGVRWYFNGVLIPDTGSVITPQQAGDYTAVAINASGCSSQASNTISFIGATGIAELNEADILIYPNPSNGKFTIQLPHMPGEPTEVSVIDLLGKELIKDMVQLSTQTFELKVVPGTYMVIVKQEGQLISRKKLFIH